jgi:hypothetical protein
MSLREQMAQDMKYCILNNDEFAETIVYTPFGQSGKTLKAIVIRERLETSQLDSGRSLSRQAEIHIANDLSLGVVSVSKGKDEVQMPVYEGGSPLEIWSVIDVLSKDSGAWRLLVQR